MDNGSGFHTHLRFFDFPDAADVALVQNVPIYIGSLTVLAKTGYAVGYGQYDALDNAVGRISAVLKDTGAAIIKGKLRISYRNAHNQHIETVGEFDIESLNQTAINLKQPLPQWGNGVTEDKKIILEIIAYESGKTFDVSASDIDISATRYNFM